MINLARHGLFGHLVYVEYDTYNGYIKETRASIPQFD